MESHEESFLKVLLWLILFITGVSGQTMILSRNLSEQVTPCKTGMRLNDNFLIRCQLDATGVNLSTFSDQVFFWRRQGSTAFQPECPVYLSDPCSNVPRRGCYCSSNSSQVYQLVYNDTAQTIHINADIQMMWTKMNAPSPVSSNILQLLDIYAGNNAVLELTVNGQLYAGTLSGNCDFSFTAKQQNKLELRAKNTATPCYLRISLSSNGSTVVDNRADYASLTFTLVDETVTAVVEISYSVCTQSNYIAPVSCKGFTDLGSPATASSSVSSTKTTTSDLGSSTTASSSVSSTKTTTSDSTENDVDVGAILGGVAAGIVVIILVIMIVLIVRIKGFLKKHVNQRNEDTHMHTVGSVKEDIVREGELTSLPKTQNKSGANTVLSCISTSDPDYENTVPDLDKEDVPPYSHYEELTDVSSVSPDNSSDYINKGFSDIQNNVVQYENTVSAL